MAIEKYLQRHAEPEARALLLAAPGPQWKQVLVVPAYREAASYARELGRLANVQAGLLSIVVRNQPDIGADSHCNDRLRGALLEMPLEQELAGANARLLQTNRGGHVLLLERPDPLPSSEGVGLARKLGCDVALALIHRGDIDNPWIHSSDADARLPADYFTVSAAEEHASAITYPFRHELPEDPLARQAMILYELKLQSYVEGLARASSPYAFHTLGSCLAIRGSAYAKVRGFPRRAGAEDFYILNKLAKLGHIAQADCEPLRLSPRLSDRVPFGTGPAMTELLRQPEPSSRAIFYHPHCYNCLAALLRHVDHIDCEEPGLESFEKALGTHKDSLAAITGLGLERFLAHASEQCADARAFKRQFHQWFDGFRTLKFIHAIRDAGWDNVSAPAETTAAGA